MQTNEIKSESSIDCGFIFPLSCDINAAFYLGAVVWGPFFEAVELEVWTAHEHYMNTKISLGLRFHAGAIWDQPWAGNRAGNRNLSLKICQGHQKLKNLEK